MSLPTSIATDHKDLILDVAFDFHGKRMATASSDQYIKIFDLIDSEWICTSSWKGHSGVIWKVIWAYPEFGQVIATCSYDRTVTVWEEIPNEEGSGQWVKRGNLVDSRSPIVDIKFAPRYLGLKLAICSVDGNVRIYEATDIMNISQWSLQFEITCKATCSCIAWSLSRYHPSLLLIGSEDSNNMHNILIFEYNSETRLWLKIDCNYTTSGPIRNICFSPNLGRSYHLVAIAASEISLLQIKQIPQKITSVNLLNEYEIKLVTELNDHKAQVWRLSWNITGTILASSGDDARVRLWKSNYMDNWKCVDDLKNTLDSPNISYPNSFNKPYEINSQLSRHISDEKAIYN